MKNYIKAELFRQKHIKSHLLAIGLTITFPILFAFFMKFIIQYQDVVFLGNHFLYIMYMYLLIGFYLVYPIVICSHTIKPKYIVRQLLTSKMTKRELFISDIIYTSFMNICYITLHSLVSIFCAVLIFKIDNSMVSIADSMTIERFMTMMGVIALTTVFSNSLLYCFQLISDNKMLSTGVFIFIIYIIPLILAQLRFFSPLVDKIAFFIPFLQVMLYYKYESSIIYVLIVHFVSFILVSFLFIILYNNKEE